MSDQTMIKITTVFLVLFATLLMVDSFIMTQDIKKVEKKLQAFVEKEPDCKRHHREDFEYECPKEHKKLSKAEQRLYIEGYKPIISMSSECFRLHLGDKKFWCSKPHVENNLDNTLNTKIIETTKNPEDVLFEIKLDDGSNIIKVWHNKFLLGGRLYATGPRD